VARGHRWRRWAVSFSWGMLFGLRGWGFVYGPRGPFSRAAHSRGVCLFSDGRRQIVGVGGTGPGNFLGKLAHGYGRFSASLDWSIRDRLLWRGFAGKKGGVAFLGPRCRWAFSGANRRCGSCGWCSPPRWGVGNKKAGPVPRMGGPLVAQAFRISSCWGTRSKGRRKTGLKNKKRAIRFGCDRWPRGGRSTCWGRCLGQGKSAQTSTTGAQRSAKAVPGLLSQGGTPAFGLLHGQGQSAGAAHRSQRGGSGGRKDEGPVLLVRRWTGVAPGARGWLLRSRETRGEKPFMVRAGDPFPGRRPGKKKIAHAGGRATEIAGRASTAPGRPGPVRPVGPCSPAGQPGRLAGVPQWGAGGWAAAGGKLQRGGERGAEKTTFQKRPTGRPAKKKNLTRAR